MEIKCRITFDNSFFKELEKAQKIALEQTAQQVYADLVMSQTVPKDTGDLEGILTYPDYSEAERGIARIISMGPYARRLYFHPEFNFRTDKNPSAGARWLDPYLPGHSKSEYIPTTFAACLRRRLSK